MTTTITPADDNGRAYLPAEFLKAYNHVRTLSSDELIERGYINIDKVIDGLRPTEYVVTLSSVSDNSTIRTIKEVREHARLGLAEARSLVDTARMNGKTATVLVTVSQQDARKLWKELTALGNDAQMTER